MRRNFQKQTATAQQRICFLSDGCLPLTTRAGKAAIAHYPSVQFFVNHQSFRQHLFLPPFPRPASFHFQNWQNWQLHLNLKVSSDPGFQFNYTSSSFLCISASTLYIASCRQCRNV
ncbi:MAG: hypothetical protein QM579_06425 [Desulfovibrio sp.]|uniref:hypothetical protein n=1 Tax=Desulfovibrio sp. TaxID=885 RepID=UPI0039E26751